jgi:HK97 family phage prohead protease
MSEQTLEQVARMRSGLSLPADIPVEVRSAVVDGVDFANREITLIAVPYNETAIVEYRGELLEEEVLPGAFTGIDTSTGDVTVNRDHDPKRVVGIVTGYDTLDQRGLISTIKVSRTPLGDETLALADDKILKASVGMLVRRSDQIIRQAIRAGDLGKRAIKRAYLDHIGMLPNPAYTGAAVLSVRQAQAIITTAEGESMTPNMDAILALLNEG